MIKDRLTAVQKRLPQNNLDGLFVSSVPTITYLTGFCGFDNEDRNAFLLITKTAQYIFTHGIYKEAAQTHVKDFTLIDIDREHPLSSSLKTLIEDNHIEKLGFEAGDLSVLEFQSLTKQINAKIFIPADTFTESIRIKKSVEEITSIAKACKLGDTAFTFLCTQIKEGITEKELALAYELFIRKAGAQISFDTIIAFGQNGSLPHHIPTDKTLTKNNFIVMDFGVRLDNYCSDMTRTVFFGTADEKQKNMYQTVLTSQEKAIEYVRKSYTNHGTTAVKASEVDKIARSYIISKEYPDMPHSLGHGIGLMVHEQPRLSPYSTDILSEGMVFSIEPGIYLPNIAGIRIEDLIVLEKNNVKLLTNAPKDLIELS